MGLDIAEEVDVEPDPVAGAEDGLGRHAERPQTTGRAGGADGAPGTSQLVTAPFWRRVAMPRRATACRSARFSGPATWHRRHVQNAPGASTW